MVTNLDPRVCRSVMAFAIVLSPSFVGAQETALPTIPSDTVIVEQAPETTLADDLIGLPVTGQQEKRIGTVATLLFDADHEIAGVVIELSGFLGFGSKQVALSRDAVEFREEEGRPVVALVDLTAAQLEIAPDFLNRDALEFQQQQQQSQQERQLQLEPGQQ
ncbi:PRC-barrel domain-containing protein [Meridianimarinicoccus sp. RP-17]|uniref:PRC-barrel domain-containing protein n=1 Tax=Meridianimarinicoccus zhengii TaxID=2056810 RepID=UPI000DAD6A6E|nr:PRC-barrel domain-containing protein [Phycocomes zhengii]